MACSHLGLVILGRDMVSGLPSSEDSTGLVSNMTFLFTYQVPQCSLFSHHSFPVMWIGLLKKWLHSGYTSYVVTSF